MLLSSPSGGGAHRGDFARGENHKPRRANHRGGTVALRLQYVPRVFKIRGHTVCPYTTDPFPFTKTVAAAMEAGEVVKVVMPGPTLADGLAVPTVGPRSFEVCRNRVDKLVTVSEKDISVALLRLVELEKLIQEGAGAAGIAAVLAGKFPELKDKNVAVLLCGGNIDTSTLGNVLERGLVNDSRLIRFSGTCVRLSQIQAHCFISQLVTVRTDYPDCLSIHRPIHAIHSSCEGTWYLCPECSDRLR